MTLDTCQRASASGTRGAPEPALDRRTGEIGKLAQTPGPSA